jgi:fission process protein 1
MKDIDENNEIFYNKMKIKVIDLTIWHTFASMILPAITIHTIVNTSTKGLKLLTKSTVLPNKLKILPTVIGLCSIPLIIHPLDHITDYAMDSSVRKLYKIVE